MNKKDEERLFTDQPLRNLMEYKRRKNKLKETDIAVGEVGEQPRMCVQLDMEQIKELKRWQLSYSE